MQSYSLKPHGDIANHEANTNDAIINNADLYSLFYAFYLLTHF